MLFKCNINGVFKVKVSLLIDDIFYFKVVCFLCYFRKFIDYVMYVLMWKIDYLVLLFEVWMKKKKMVNIFFNFISIFMCLVNFDILKLIYFFFMCMIFFYKNY